jgi:hypothetical protein
VWQRCQARTCPQCGPELQERNLGHDLRMMAGHQMTRKVVARAAWAAVRAKVKRAGGQRITYPQPGGMLAVYATAGLTGAVVTDQAASAAADYARIPEGERISRSKDWALTSARGKADRPVAWKSAGKSGIPERVPAILRDQGLYRSQVAADLLSRHAWEAHNFTMPPEGSTAYERFAYAVGLHWSHHGNRRTEAA